MVVNSVVFDCATVVGRVVVNGEYLVADMDVSRFSVVIFSAVDVASAVMVTSLVVVDSTVVGTSFVVVVRLRVVISSFVVDGTTVKS